MSTNYYFRWPSCPTCGHEGRSLHIGKSSAGWCFALQVLPAEGINNLLDWEMYWDSHPIAHIENEYGEVLDVPAMLKVIKERSWPRCDTSLSEEFLRHNHAVAGPTGLARSEVDMEHCVGHGDTWDLIRDDFS